MSKFQFFSVSHPFVKVECEGIVKTTGHSDRKDAMFPEKNIVLNIVCFCFVSIVTIVCDCTYSAMVLL